MEIEEAIILALSEPTNYTNLRRKAQKIRRRHGKTLSNEAFDEALKRLRDEKIVLRKEIDGRTVEYSLNQDTLSVVKYVNYIAKKERKRIEVLEKLTKFIEKRVDKINDHRTFFTKMGDKDTLKAIIPKNMVQEFQAFIMELMKYILSLEKLSFFFNSKIWGTSLTKKYQLEHQKQYSDFIDRLAQSSINLDKNFAYAVQTIIRKELTDEAELNTFDPKSYEKLLRFEL